VLDRDGIVRAGEADPDYTVRMERVDIVAAIRDISGNLSSREEIKSNWWKALRREYGNGRREKVCDGTTRLGRRKGSPFADALERRGSRSSAERSSPPSR